jgi:hypothetical protein
MYSILKAILIFVFLNLDSDDDGRIRSVRVESLPIINYRWLFLKVKQRAGTKNPVRARICHSFVFLILSPLHVYIMCVCVLCMYLTIKENYRNVNKNKGKRRQGSFSLKTILFLSPPSRSNSWLNSRNEQWEGGINFESNKYSLALSSSHYCS